MENKKYLIEVELDGWFYYYGLNKNYMPESNYRATSPQDPQLLMSKNLKGFNSKQAAQRIIDEGIFIKNDAENVKIIELDM